MVCITIEKSKFYSIVGEEAPNKLNFPNTEIKIPEGLKSLLKKTLKENPKIIEYGLKKKSSFADVSLSASKLLPKLDLNFTAQNAWAPNTFFEEYENYKNLYNKRNNQNISEIRDIINKYALKGSFGTAFESDATGYLFVYHLEILIIFITLITLGGLSQELRKANFRINDKKRFGLAEIPS